MCGPYATKPSAVDKNNTQALRNCLGKFATGVTVVTCDGADGPCGITANSFSSVSLEPPLVLWNVDKRSTALQAFLEAQRFAINVLRNDQKSLAVHFARPERISFEGIDYRLNGSNVPLLETSLACMECRTDRIIEAGDHYIIIGEIENYVTNDGEPLLFFAGDYRG
ncbi:MAG: flavin reductase [Woeseiaceae bacterium]|nr:flavin reductase [Woeseiaceae bacterium]